MDFDFLSNEYPAKNYTNGEKLFTSLGSFWTQVFQEQGTLKGYTLGLAEELIQSYIDLVEVLNSYAVNDIPVLATSRWQPIVITKSKFNQAPLTFDINSSVFGAQPESDAFYRGKVFNFGKPKSTTGSVYSFNVSTNLRKFSVIADRIISPSFLAINGVHVSMDTNNNIFFNSNVFENSAIPRAAIVGDDGKPKTFIDPDGNEVNDELLILWCYNAENDEEYLYDNFGRLFDLKLPSSEVYKQMLSSIFNLFVAGPTVNAVKSIMAAFNGITPVKNPEETIEKIYSDSLFQYVVTDKEVYRFETYQQLAPLSVGDVVYGGAILINAIEYFDMITEPGWWKSALPIPRLGISSHIFVGNYKQQLFFSTGAELATLSSAGVINFPVHGTQGDIDEFNRHINLPENKPKVMKALGLTNPGSSSVITPVDFLFTNIFKNNTALLKFNFYSQEELAMFFSYLPVIKNYLPPHVYLLFYVNLNLNTENYSQLNSRYSLPEFSYTPLSIDGSLSNGLRPEVYPEDQNYYKEYISRLFCISKSPLANDNNPLFYSENLEEVTLANSERMSGIPRAIDGKVFTTIHATNPPPTNEDVPTVLLIDFS